jgi:hypothetical protein
MKRLSMCHTLAVRAAGDTSEDIRYCRGSFMDPAVGWQGWWNDYVNPLIAATGIKRHFLDRIGGVPESGVVQFGAIKHAARINDLKHLYRHRDFVRFWEPIVEEMEEVVGYIGTPTLDLDYLARVNDPQVKMDKLLQYQHDSLNSILESGMNVGFDANVASECDETDWTVTRQLVEDGKNKGLRVYVEARGNGTPTYDYANTYCFEATNGHKLFGGKPPWNYNPPKDWQDPDETLLKSYAGYLLLLHVDELNFVQTPAEQIDIIQNWLDLGYDICLPNWIVDKIIKADRWPEPWIGL